MNCTALRKYLYAFADGQLSVQVNCRVLDHLKMCSQCSRIVDEHQALRAALRRNIATVQVPRGLEGRVRRAITISKPVKRPAVWRFVFGTRALAAAACLAWVGTVSWQYMLPDRAPNQAGVVGPAADLAGGSLASMLVMKHNKCCRRGGLHHAQALPRDAGVAAAEIAARFGNLVKVLAPDLSRHGFEFESANFCGVKSPDCGVGGHLIYVRREADQTARFSIFSAPRWDGLDRCRGGPTEGREVRQVVVPQDDRAADMRLAIWHEDTSSYVCCGAVDGDAMDGLIEDVRMALGNPKTRQMFAMLWQSRGDLRLTIDD